MNFNNNGNGNQKTLTKNTRGIRFYNSIDQYGSTMTLDMWQGFANIKINPLLPKEQRSQSQMYDYQNGLGILLSVEKVETLKKCFEYVAEEVINGNYNFQSVGVTNGKKDNLIQFVPVSVLTGNEEDIGIGIQICSGIGQDGRAQSVLSYILNEESYLINYNPATGDYQESNKLEIEFLIFGKYLDNVVNALTMCIPHVVAMDSLYRNSYINKSLSEIKNKLGIQNNYGNNSYQNGGNINNNFSFPSSTTPNFELGSNITNGGTIESGERLNLDDL